MGIWNFYFIAKLFLYFGEYMGFHVWLNLAFALFLAVPVPEFIRQAKRLRLLRQVIAIPLGISLFYYDTWLPPIKRVYTQASMLEGFSASYLVELIGRFINPMVVAALVLLFAAYFLAKKKLRVSSFVFIAILFPLLPFVQVKTPFKSVEAVSIAAGSGPASAADASPASGSVPGPAPVTNASLSEQLNNFYRNEAGRTVSYPPPAPMDPPFDILILQVCSLSWDDLDFTSQRNNPMFSHFDIVFNNFNSAASYSGPAAIRLLRGSCGQTRHKALYDPAPSRCYMMDDLKDIGFEQQLLMNHDGHYGGFLEDVRERGGLKVAPFGTKGLAPYLLSFDGSPVYDDYSVLSQWWENRLQSGAGRVALYYNTISLHDGNYYDDAKSRMANRRKGTLETYPTRQQQLLEDMDRFFSMLEASGRRVVVIFIPEHGASVRGDRMQIAGLREIPTPRISLVPVGIKLVGVPEKPGAKPVVITKPSSYLALSELLSGFIRIDPFGGSLPLEDYVRDLPATDFVAENEDVVVMRRNKHYYIHSSDAEWLEYDPD